MNPDRRRRELAHRSGDGTDVTLFWDAQTDELLVCVSDELTGAHFEIHPERELALDVFHHPFAYRGEGHLAAWVTPQSGRVAGSGTHDEDPYGS
jgi:hypothetical protein